MANKTTTEQCPRCQTKTEVEKYPMICPTCGTYAFTAPLPAVPTTRTELDELAKTLAGPAPASTTTKSRKQDHKST